MNFKPFREASLKLKAALQDVLNKAVCSIGTIIELKDTFKNMRDDPLFVEICPLLEKSNLDMRSQLNYALLLFSTGKVIKDKWTYFRQGKIVKYTAVTKTQGGIVP